MKRWAAILLVWCFPLWGTAAHIHWMGNYDKALQRAHQEHKPLLVLVTDKGKASQHTIATQLMHQPYIEAMNKHFVAVIVTYEGEENYPIEMYYTTVFPTLFLVDSSRELFLRKPLYGKEITTEALAKIMQDLAIIPTKQTR